MGNAWTAILVDSFREVAHRLGAVAPRLLAAVTLAVLGWLVGGWNPAAVSGLANMAAVYDYYKDVLGRTSFDGNGAEIIAVVDYNPAGPLGNLIFPFPNAWWSPGDQMIVFGRTYGAALDIVGHEFTHAVVSYVVGGLGGGESGALNEAYADILGNLIEDKTDEALGRFDVGLKKRRRRYQERDARDRLANMTASAKPHRLRAHHVRTGSVVNVQVETVRSMFGLEKRANRRPQ